MGMKQFRTWLLPHISCVYNAHFHCYFTVSLLVSLTPAELPFCSTCCLGCWASNHFSEMKGDVGMSRHEKEGEQEDTYTETGNH